MSKRTKLNPKREELIDRFADVFHSFKDLHNVTPLAFLAKLERNGITISRKPKSPAICESNQTLTDVSNSSGDRKGE